MSAGYEFVYVDPECSEKAEFRGKNGKQKDENEKRNGNDNKPYRVRVTPTVEREFIDSYVTPEFGCMSDFVAYLAKCYRAKEPVVWRGSSTTTQSTASLKDQAVAAKQHHKSTAASQPVLQPTNKLNSPVLSTPLPTKDTATAPNPDFTSPVGLPPMAADLHHKLGLALGTLTRYSSADQASAQTARDQQAAVGISPPKSSKKKRPMSKSLQTDSHKQKHQKVPSKKSVRRRVADFEDVLKSMCLERKEIYSDVLAQLCANRRAMPTAQIMDVVDTGKCGKVKAEIIETIKKARKALTGDNMVEIAALVEELCIPDSAYHRLRTACGLQDELPTLYKIKKNRAKLNNHLIDFLSLQELQDGGWAVDYTKLWDWVVDLINTGVFPNAEYVDGDKLVGIFTFDGRSIGGRSQIYVGLKFPYLNWGKTQSSDVIFPVAILPGSDGVKNTAAKFNSQTVAGGLSLMDQLKQIKHAAPRMVQHHGQEKQIRFVQHFAADQKSEWGFYNICQKVMSDENPDAEMCTYCTCCNAPDQKGDFTKTHPGRERSDLPFNPTTDSTFCLLHM